jgi:hypothetical protein
MWVVWVVWCAAEIGKKMRHRHEAAEHAAQQSLELARLRESSGGGGGEGVARVINGAFWTEAEAVGSYTEFQGCFEGIVEDLFELGLDAVTVQRVAREVLGAATACFREYYAAERARLQGLPETRGAGAVGRVMRSEFCSVATDELVALATARCMGGLPAALGTAKLVPHLHFKWVRLWLSVQCWLALNLEDLLDVETGLSGLVPFDAAVHRKCGPVPDDGLCAVVLPPLILAGKLVAVGVVGGDV